MIESSTLPNKYFNTIPFFFLIIVFQLSVPAISADLLSEDNMTVEQALDEQRLIEILYNPQMTGLSGGPSMTLSDGTTINRQTIYEAIQPLIRQGYSICGDLLEALRSEKVHTRYGSLLALKLMTRWRTPYYPFFDPTDPRNIEGYEKWKAYLEEIGCLEPVDNQSRVAPATCCRCAKHRR